MSVSRLRDSKLVRHVRRHWLSVAFILGFASDFLLLNQVDSLLDNAFLFGYLFLATFSLLLFYLTTAEKVPERARPFLNRFMPILMQYAFGGLLSGMLIFYGRSGDFMASLPFYLLLVAVVIGNEAIAKRSNRLVFNLALYFIGLFSYVVFVTPLLIGSIAPWVFVLSGVVALVIMITLIRVLRLIIPQFLYHEWRKIIFTIGSLYALFNFLYFLNLIPPIPLSVTVLEIYQNVEKAGERSYRVVDEKVSWWRVPFSYNVFRPGSNGAFCFARVYAPINISASVTHVWEYYDEGVGGWKEHFRLSYPLSVWNDRGYGGYTNVRSLRDGVWSCSVKTERGQTLGRIVFRVDLSQTPQRLETKIE